jgi:hypothetical protein
MHFYPFLEQKVLSMERKKQQEKTLRFTATEGNSAATKLGLDALQIAKHPKRRRTTSLP